MNRPRKHATLLTHTDRTRAPGEGLGHTCRWWRWWCGEGLRARPPWLLPRLLPLLRLLYARLRSWLRSRCRLPPEAPLLLRRAEAPCSDRGCSVRRWASNAG